MAIPDSQVGITISFCVLVLIDIIGNVLVCIVIATNRSLRTPMNYLLMNLACADIVVAIFQAWRFIFVYTFQHPSGYEGVMMCTFLTGGTFTWVGGLASAYALVVIAIERYHTVVHPHHSKWRLTNFKIKLIVGLSWAAAVIIVIPLFLTRTYNEKRDFCIENWPNKTVSKIYGFSWVIVAGLIPITIMSVLYFRIVMTIWFSGPAVVECAQKARTKSRKILTKILILITAIYAVCWMPVLIIYVIAQFGPTYIGSTLHEAGLILVTLNSTINPLLYTFHSRQFRKHLKKVLICKAPYCLHLRSRIVYPNPGVHALYVRGGARRMFVTTYHIKVFAPPSIAEDRKGFKEIPEFLSVMKDSPMCK